MFQGQDVGKGLWHEMPAQVEFSAMHLPLLPIYLEAISGSSCICWQTKIAAFLRATILVSDRGSMPFCWTTTLTSNILLFRATSVEQKKQTPDDTATQVLTLCNKPAWACSRWLPPCGVLGLLLTYLFEPNLISDKEDAFGEVLLEWWLVYAHFDEP